ncbi:aspartate-semialdehyde dehydrogenase [candidate division WOR-3 bacterium]|nr:aspartate-semialdehyde dehydrogenase [candidate division WOR-3 bacterium]
MKNIAVLGVRNMIGSELIKILEQRDFPAGEVYFTAPGDTGGEETFFKDKEVRLQNNYDAFADNVDIVFCCLDRVQARSAASKFKKKALFIDCARAFSSTPGVPCVIPEINGEVLMQQHNLVTNPWSMTIQLLMVLHPLHVNFQLKHLHVVGLAAVSDLDWDAVDELSYEYEYLATGLNIEKCEGSVFPHTIGGNLIPQVGDFARQGDTEEEAVLAKEVSMMLGTADIKISATMVWAPVRRGHCLAVSAGFERKTPLVEVRDILKKAPGVTIVKHDDEYPMPESVVGKDEVFVGRLRADKVFDNGLSMWIACDNLRKGSALNAVQIAELLPA